MENHETYENKRERQRDVQKLTLAALAVMTVVIIGYVAWAIATESMNIMVFGFLLGGFVVVYLVMSDIVEPYRLGLFQGLTQERRSAFLKMMLMDVIGGGALIYWIVGLDSESGGDILIPLLIYFLTAQLKRKYRAEFDGTASEEEAADEDAVEEEEEAAEEEAAREVTAEEEAVEGMTEEEENV